MYGTQRISEIPNAKCGSKFLEGAAISEINA